MDETVDGHTELYGGRASREQGEQTCGGPTFSGFELRSRKPPPGSYDL